MKTALLGLGSNIGARVIHLRRAVDALRAHADIQVVAVSSVYETPAMTLPGTPSQPPYVNAVIEVTTSLTPSGLLAACLAIEQANGRVRSVHGRWEPRTLDIDIIHMPGEHVTTAELTLPHPRLADRRFVLEPLAEIRPSLEIGDPINQSVEYLLSHCSDPALPTRIPLDEPL